MSIRIKSNSSTDEIIDMQDIDDWNDDDNNNKKEESIIVNSGLNDTLTEYQIKQMEDFYERSSKLKNKMDELYRKVTKRRQIYEDIKKLFYEQFPFMGNVRDGIYDMEVYIGLAKAVLNYICVYQINSLYVSELTMERYRLKLTYILNEWDNRMKRLNPNKDRRDVIQLSTSLFSSLVTKGEEDTDRMAYLILYSVRESPIIIDLDEIGLEY